MAVAPPTKPVPAQTSWDQAVPRQAWDTGEFKRTLHVQWRRLRFAGSLFSPFAALSTVSLGKDLYLLEFGASAVDLGVILLVCSILSPIMDGIVGRLQDAGKVMGRCFPLERWGRRAPWCLTHICLMAVAELLFFLPPSYNRWVLNMWFFFIWILGYWTVAATINAFEAARVEIYPSKEERVQLELFCKVTVIAGSGFGSGIVFICLTMPSNLILIVSGFMSGTGTLLGLIGVDVMREARSLAVSTTQRHTWRDTLAVVFSPCAWRMMLLRFFVGSYEAVLFGCALYYFTFVYKLNKVDRVYWLGLFGMVTGSTDLLTAPFWTWLFSRSTSCMLYGSVTLRFVDVLLAPLLLLSSTEPIMFVIYAGVWRLCNAPYSFWRIAAGAWACDAEGVGNEGLLNGCWAMVMNAGRAITAALITFGLDWAGYVASNCLSSELTEDEVERCEEDKIHNQPESLATYLVTLITVVAPALSVVIALLTLEFPIRPGSKVLNDIMARQKASQAQTDANMVPELLGAPSAAKEAAATPSGDNALEQAPRPTDAERTSGSSKSTQEVCLGAGSESTPSDKE